MSLRLNTRTVRRENRSTLPRERLADALRDVPAKVLARITGRTPRAAERWKCADNGMTIETLFALARDLDQVWDVVRDECGRAESVEEAEQLLNQVRKLLDGRP